MNNAYLGAMLLVLTGCTAANASAINLSDDLHCAVVIRTLERHADRLGATPTARKGLYVLRTWYFSKIRPGRLVEAQTVVAAITTNPGQVPSAGQTCSNRAYGDPAFSRWKTVASDGYDRRAVR